MLSRLEVLELIACAATASATALFAPPVWDLAWGTLLCYSAALLLGQGLIRDIALIIRRRAKGESTKPGTRITCLCAESSLGLLAIASGILLLLIGAPWRLSLPAWGSGALVAAVLALGFLIKDSVIKWTGRGLRLEHDPEHANIIVW